ncbi:MAG TPA: TraR/DksA family transcriptional regulator [Anaeromyxobacter sp.]|nr:TraR/DksA family transcriptional regulator [Anaeromyxobacter sp.]
MSDLDLESVRGELQHRRHRILETVRRERAELEGLQAAERDPEFEEGAQSEHEQYTLARLSDAQRREVAAITAALLRIDEGEYGICAECEQEIDPRRLAALPTALFCTDCARRREQRATAPLPSTL